MRQAHCPPGASFPARGDVDEPSHAIMRVGTLAAPLTLRMRHVREGYGGGERRSIPNIAWDSGLVLARWISRHPELVVGKSVLEIGAGLGAPSMAAARQGASTVALTDVDPLATRNAAYNARMNLGRVASAKVKCVTHDEARGIRLRLRIGRDQSRDKSRAGDVFAGTGAGTRDSVGSGGRTRRAAEIGASRRRG